jgi:hypothetical protein
MCANCCCSWILLVQLSLSFNRRLQQCLAVTGWFTLTEHDLPKFFARKNSGLVVCTPDGALCDALSAGHEVSDMHVAAASRVTHNIRCR